MKKKLVTLIWLVLESYFVYRLYADNSSGSMVACDYLGACMLFTPMLFPFVLFMIWKPANRKWWLHTLLSIVVSILIPIFVILIIPQLINLF